MWLRVCDLLVFDLADRVEPLEFVGAANFIQFAMPGR